MAIDATDKKYLDANGVKTLWKKVTARIATDVAAETTARETAIGTLTVAEGKTATVENAIAKAKADTEAKITALGGDAVLSISVNGTDVAKDADNNVALTDIASKDALDALTATVGTASGTDGQGQAIAATGLTADIETNTAAIGELKTKMGTTSVAEQIAAVTGTPDKDTTLQAEIDAVEGRLDTIEGTGEGSVAKALADANDYTDDAIGGLEADFTGDKAVASTSGHVTVGIKEEDGVITSVTVADNDIASADALSKLQAVVGYSELATGENAGQDANTVKARLVALESAVGEGGSVDAQIKAITGTPDTGSTLQAEIDALEALHADKTGEGATGKQTVAEEVNAAVTALVDGAPEALDTLKEIADWIANQDESGVTDAATLVARVDANVEAIGTKAVANTAGEGEASNAKAATGLYKYVDDAVAAAAGDAADAVAGLNAEVTSTGGAKVTVTVKEEEGVITTVTVAEDDIASAALLGTTADAKTAETAFGKIAAEADRAATAEGALSDRLDVLEGDATVAGSVAEAKAAADAAAALIGTDSVADQIDAAVAVEEERAEAAEKAIADYVGNASGTNGEGQNVAATGLTLLVETNAANIKTNADDIDALEAAVAKIVPLTDDEITDAITAAEAAE